MNKGENMRFIGVCLFICISSVTTAQEKDYSLFDYNVIISDQQWGFFYKERNRLEKLTPVNSHPYTIAALLDPHVAIEMTLAALNKVRLDYIPDKKLRAYRIAESAMLMAQVLDRISNYSKITKSQIHRAWRSNHKNVSRVMALCKKHPKDASNIIERFKRDLRWHLSKKLIQ